MYFSVVFQGSLSKHMSVVPVCLPAMGQQVSSWLSWMLCSFVTLPALGEKDVNPVVERDEGMAHRRVMVIQASKQHS